MTTLTPEQQQWLLKSTSELGLTTRTVNALELHGVYTVHDLLHCTPQQLLSISNFGAKTLSAIYARLAGIGFYRKGHVAPMPKKTANTEAKKFFESEPVRFPKPTRYHKKIS